MNEYEKALNQTEDKEEELLTDTEKQALVVYAILKSFNNDFLAKASVESKLSLAEATKYNRLDNYIGDVFKQLDKLKLNIPKLDRHLKNVADINFEATARELSDILGGKKISLNKSEYDDLVQTIFKNPAIENNILRSKIKFEQQARQAVSANDGIQKLNQKAKKIVEETTEHNQTIIRTQTTKTMNNSRQLGMQKANEKVDAEIGKKWVSRRDEKVRASHKALDNGVAISLEETFANGLMYPGDPSGPVEEVINCRCELEHDIMS